MSYTDGQRKIKEFFHTGGGLTSLVTESSMSPVAGSSTSSVAGSSTSSVAGSLTNPVEDLNSHPEDKASPEHKDEPAKFQHKSESLSKTDEPTNSYDSTTSTTATSSSCKCQCCSNVSTPHHLLVVDSSKKKQLYSSKQHGRQKSHSRTIQSGWYKAHPWISVCTSEYKVYCATCRAANEQGLLTSKPIKSSFIHHGFNNWKKALEKFREHECSNMHKEGTEKLATKARGVAIDAQLKAQLRNNQEHHRKMLMKLIQAIQYLSHQGSRLTVVSREAKAEAASARRRHSTHYT